jgi:hypothetical protein
MVKIKWYWLTMIVLVLMVITAGAVYAATIRSLPVSIEIIPGTKDIQFISQGQAVKALDFQGVMRGTSISIPITVKNTGMEPLNLKCDAVTAAWGSVTALPNIGTLLPGASANITVTVTANANAVTGNYTASIEFYE